MGRLAKLLQYYIAKWLLYPENDYNVQPDLIFVTNIKNYIRGEKIVMWRNFSFPCMTIVENLKTSPYVEKIQYNWWGLIAIYAVFAKSVIHAVLLRIFYHNLRAFMWRKIEPIRTFVEKKWVGIWGLGFSLWGHQICNKSSQKENCQRYNFSMQKNVSSVSIWT